MFNCTELNDLYYFIEGIKDKLSNNELNEITDIYNGLVESIEYNEYLEKEAIQFEDTVHQYEAHKDSIQVEIETLFDRWDDEKEIHELMDAVTNIIITPVSIKEEKSNKDQLQENEILKLVKQGYKFISGLGAEIYNNYIAKKEYEENKRQKESEAKEQFKKFKNLLPSEVRYSKVEIIDNNVYSVSGYHIDTIVDMSTGKVKGKGSRNFKDDIIKRVSFFINYEKDNEKMSVWA